jgi:hypothetical protein
MADFFSAYDDMLQEISKQPTTVKQDEVHRNLAKKLDEKLRNQTWEFHCRITDIQPANNGRFNVTHELPDEFGNPDQRWSGRTSATLTFDQKQALNLKPGDFVIYTGTPRFVAKDLQAFTPQQSRDTQYFTSQQQIAGRYLEHALHITNLKVRFQKDLDAKGEEKPVIQRVISKKSAK